MPHSIVRRHPSLLLAVLLAVAVPNVTGAEIEPDTIRIEAGQMVEIGIDTASPHPDFSWILTKDHAFQSAQRTRFFQTRLIQQGTYVLDVSVTDPAVNQNEYRAFTIVVTDIRGLAPPPPSSSGSLKAMLTTDPPAIDGTVYLPPQGGMLMIDASRSSGRITSYALDLDSTVDADGDGNTQNDHDNRDTFSEKSGQVRYFMLPGPQPRSIWLTVTDAATGQTDRTSLTIAFAAAPRNTVQPQVGGQNTGIIIKREEKKLRFRDENSTASFSAGLPETMTARQLLYEWDFGDHSRSLLSSPSHTYALPGTYTVALTVRDIATGQVLFTGTNSVQVFGTGASSSSPAGKQASEPPASSNSAASVSKTSLKVSSIIKVGIIILLLLAVAIGLYFLFTWIKRRTTGSLEKTLESMERNIVKPEAKSFVDVKVEPLKIKKESPKPLPQAAKLEDIADREKAKTEFRTQARDNAVPGESAGPVPSWLAKASTTPVPAPKPTPAPPPKPTTAPAAKPAPAPVTSTPVLAKTAPPLAVANAVDSATALASAVVPAAKPAAVPTTHPAAQQPKPSMPPAVPVPTPTPKPAPSPQAPAPASVATPSPETKKPEANALEKPDDDDTIAVIRADSLST